MSKCESDNLLSAGCRLFVHASQLFVLNCHAVSILILPALRAQRYASAMLVSKFSATGAAATLATACSSGLLHASACFSTATQDVTAHAPSSSSGPSSSSRIIDSNVSQDQAQTSQQPAGETIDFGKGAVCITVMQKAWTTNLPQGPCSSGSPHTTPAHMWPLLQLRQASEPLPGKRRSLWCGRCSVTSLAAMTS